MSFILDALKKSEIERQRQAVPGLMDARSAPRRSRLPVWVLLLAALLGINIALLAVLLRREAPVAATVAATGAGLSGQRQAAAAPEATDHFSPLDAAPVYAPEIPVAAADAGATGGERAMASAPGSGLGAGAEHSAVPLRSTRAHRGDPLLLGDASASANSNVGSVPDNGDDDNEVIPSISELSLTGAQSLPELHLDVHVYATKPAERFVYINMRKYHEGSTLQEGPVVERIRRDGVVLQFQGLRFLLPRQS
jgi:general secretion pathway protein B